MDSPENNFEVTKPIESSKNNEEEKEKPSFIRVIIHSFFIIPFLIAVLTLLLFGIWQVVTFEPQDIYDHLAAVKVGGATKRWQSAFELSKILSDPDKVPKETRFISEMKGVFESSKGDDPRVRQYLALAMARTGLVAFIEPIQDAIPDETEGSRFMLIVALGMFGIEDVAPAILPYLTDSSDRVRSGAATALGLAGDLSSIEDLKKALNDSNVAVSWDAALALARLGDLTGKPKLLKLLDRNYLLQFPNVDDRDQSLLMTTVIEVVAPLNDEVLNTKILELSKEDVDLNVRRIAQKVTID